MNIVYHQRFSDRQHKLPTDRAATSMIYSKRRKQIIGTIFNLIIRFVQGITVGIGAILPGISGGTLCAVFGMYRPLIEMLSSPKEGIKKHWLQAGVFLLGAGAGFVGLSGLAGALLEQNTPLLTCVFMGFIIGTLPQLWQEAGEEGRTRGSYITLAICFAVMTALLLILKTAVTLTIPANIGGYLLCGVLWGLSFIVPGLSSSTLLLFFGLYQPMLDGIASFDFSVLIPLGIGMGACVLLLAKAIGAAYKKHYSLISHGVIGIVIATTVMIFPTEDLNLSVLLWYLAAMIGGAAVSFFLSCLCDKLKEKADKN